MSTLLDRSSRSLLLLFVSWKALLLLLVVFSPGPAYDTSTALLALGRNAANTDRHGLLTPVLGLLATNLTRWDAIYFTEIARRGCLFEQEWAFNLGFASLIRTLVDVLRHATGISHALIESIIGITVAHAAHGMSAFVLYSLARAVFPGRKGRNLAFIAACLHILSPAGLFLSAPYGESTHALLSFMGSLLFVLSFSHSGAPSTLHDVLIPLSGILYGLATAARSNGLLNGMILFEEAVRLLYSMTKGITFAKTRRLIAVGMAGICTGLGFVLPQYIAYEQFCINNSDSRVWCLKTIPSIYSFVQDHYWNNGFLRYWTLSNIPLFALAGPMLAIMTYSAIWTLGVGSDGQKTGNGKSSSNMSKTQVHSEAPLTGRLLRSLAAPQITLALLTFLKHHVQIITRMSSGYPVWYFWLAHALVEGHSLASSEKVDVCRGKKETQIMNQYRYARMTVFYMVVYALVQGALFASFLPPA
ncbi:GPI mannosyltransferase 2 [Aspergillus pseudotamarii]|uniref:GPI mannosyltransferase 2 n=1 Tax=Aspergillus pseudotamarii TaxID=132259 RepID=A0A5N6SEX6_ASPPS|nr:GPI mannosyltransferase 2 [Aspergillus pseudotamarii]KAE8132409.1 GPI mannosyltransferase 2 [Aspergillus pseudotamarii]